MASNLTERAGERLLDGLQKLSRPPSVDELNATLRFLGRWRSQLLSNTYYRHHGGIIFQGPFAGMEYVTTATEGALMPRLLGTYEAGLHPHLERFAAEGIDCVIDVGCAEGYYAVGLARLMPTATVYAYDINEAARDACAKQAAKNGVADRVVIRELFQPKDFETFSGRKVLVIVDAEGAEDEILQPALSPSLAQMNLIVETHDIYKPGVKDRLIARFSPTHEITVVELGLTSAKLPAWLQEFPHLDQLLATWEWRLAPTPWLVMRPKAGRARLRSD